MTRDTNLTNLNTNIQIVTHLAIEHFNLASLESNYFMEVRSPSDTYHILYKHDTSKVSTTLLHVT